MNFVAFRLFSLPSPTFTVPLSCFPPPSTPTQCSNYGHRLDAKAIEVQCFQKNALFSDELVGTAQVDLHTVATGPISHRLTLVSALSLSGGGGGKKCGTVQFDCVMVEVAATMQVRLVNAAISMPDTGLEAGALVSLVATYSASEDVSKASNVVAPSSLKPAAAAGFVFAEALSTAGSLTDMENSVVMVSVKKHVGGRETIVGTARLSLAALYQVGASTVAFSEKILNAQTRAPSGDLQGQLQITDGPSFAQMLGGLNTSEGVQPGAQQFLSMPLPLRLLGQPQNLAALMEQV